MFSKRDGEEMRPIVAGGREYPVRLKRGKVKNAYARVNGGMVVITLPRWTGFLDTGKVIRLLYRKMERFLERHPYEGAGPNLLQIKDQQLSMLGEDYNMVVKGSRRTTIKFVGNVIEVGRPQDMPDSEILAKFRKGIMKNFTPKVGEFVAELNRRHFNNTIRAVKLRDNIYRWGSCSPDNAITLNMRLLFAPDGMLEYVAVHELAHTKYRNHSKKFWKTVESVMPDYKTRKRWIRENGAGLPTTMDR